MSGPRHLVLLLALAAGVAAAGRSPRPNILLIYTDDQPRRSVSCYADAPDWVRTPNIDRLARRGIRFDRAYIGTWCMPSRATVLTGRLQFGIESMVGSLVDESGRYDPALCPFWPRVFRAHGYFTGQIGKWHTGADTGFGRDWDYQTVWNRPRHEANAGNYYVDQLIEFNGRPATVVPGYATDNYTRWAVEFIRGDGRDRDRPWFLWLCYTAPHSPTTPADRHLGAYPGVGVPVPADIYPPRPGKPAYAANRAEWQPGPDGRPESLKNRRTVRGGRSLDDWTRQEAQCVMAIDEGVGEILQALDETGQTRNTLVVFTSDQGFAWGQHGFRLKTAPYDANLVAPLIMSMPGTLPEGRACAAPVAGQDLGPTFLAAAGIERPWTMHGRDLAPLLREPGADWPHPVLLAQTGVTFGSDTAEIPLEGGRLYMNVGVPWWLSLTDARYKYVRTLVAGEIEELYDLESDPAELQNLAANPADQPKLLAMRSRLLAELRQAGATLVDHLPPVAGETGLPSPR